MTFYENQLFHVFNQGNNKQHIFFTDENYIFFLWKMRAYLLPFGDIVAYCLMPNHYHWLFFVKNIKIVRRTFRLHVDEVEWQRRKKKYGDKAVPVEKFNQREANENDLLTLNEAIGTLEQSYTNAINKQKGWTGSLFRKRAKAKDGWINEFITLQKNGKEDYCFFPGNEYGYRCLEYIHQNPVKANMVNSAIEYPWSSAKDYIGLRKGSLCNLAMGRELIGER